MIIVDIAEHQKVIDALTKRLGEDGFRREMLGSWDCKDGLLPIEQNICLTEEEYTSIPKEITICKEICKDCPKRKYVRYADFTNDTYSFFYERKTALDFISSRKDRLYEQMNKMDMFIEARKGLILEGIGEYVPIYDAYWQDLDKEKLVKLSPLQQVITLAGRPEWTYSFIRECKMREMEFVQTWNLDETIEFLVQCDEGYDHEPKFRLIKKRYPEISLERNVLCVFDGVGKVRSEKILNDHKDIEKIISVLINKVESLGYGTYDTKEV